jgi:glycosyltransferase involved in cell wall biosynthesis
VITITRDRGEPLLRAVESVTCQTYGGRIEHIIVGDESQALRSLSSSIRARQPNAVISHVTTSKHYDKFNPIFIPSRLGFLRNVGISLANSDYICYLDDDNTFASDHVASLVATIESGPPRVDIAYSWRRLVLANGAPFTSREYLWTPEPRLATSKSALSQHIFEELVAGGIRIPGDDVVRDAVIDSRGMKVYTVDTNELMVRRYVHDQIEFVVDFEWREIVGDYCDDYAFVKRCHEAGMCFKASKMPTINYTVGGVSNRANGEMR